MTINDVMMMSAAMTVQMMTMMIAMTYDVGFMAVAAWQWREKAKVQALSQFLVCVCE